MVGTFRFSARKAQWLNAWHARAAARMRVGAEGFVSPPEPRTIGSLERGRQLVSGDYLFAGHLLTEPDRGLWDLIPPSKGYEDALHGFVWMDDLAALGDRVARDRAQKWLWGWIDRFGDGRGAVWRPGLTGQRVIRWINHAGFVLRKSDAYDEAAFYRALRQQAQFLARRWHAARPGVKRFEALIGLVYAGLSLKGLEPLADPAIKALSAECTQQIDDQGGLPNRNPEELLAVFTLLTWAASLMNDMGRETPTAHLAAIERIAPTLRSLRHSDGTLARFHGGGRGAEGWLDHALAFSGVKGGKPDGLSMGYARLAAGRTSVIIDASAPPDGPASYNAHASTLAFELTSARRPLIVNCGSGVSFGSEWRRAGRATPSHSTLTVGGYSSARLESGEKTAGREALVDGPTHVPVEITSISSGARFQGGHNGFAVTHGLTHARTLELTLDGRSLSGEDMLIAMEDADKRCFDRAVDQADQKGIRFEARFHLHPSVKTSHDLGAGTITMALKSGELWVFRHDGGHSLTLEPSIYMETTRLKPRKAQQIVLTGRVSNYVNRLRWSLSKAQETAIGVRDITLDDPYIAED